MVLAARESFSFFEGKALLTTKFQAMQFLAKMANEINFMKIQDKSDLGPQPQIDEPNRFLSFEPMRRKLQVTIKSQAEPAVTRE